MFGLTNSLLVSVALVGVPLVAQAQQNDMIDFTGKIPNANAYTNPNSGIGCQYLGNQECRTSLPLNSFGRDWRAMNETWSTEFCGKDSDDDGFTNGEELGDPCCTWTPGAAPARTINLSNPGFASSTNNAPKCQTSRETPAPSPSVSAAASPAAPAPQPSTSPVSAPDNVSPPVGGGAGNGGGDGDGSSTTETEDPSETDDETAGSGGAVTPGTGGGSESGSSGNGASPDGSAGGASGENETETSTDPSITPDANSTSDNTNGTGNGDSSSGSGDDDDGSVCFPASATVTLEDGSSVPMYKLRIGDRVQVASGEFSDVFMFSHKLSNVQHSFVTLKTAVATLSLTKGHFLYVNGGNAAVPAGSVRVGDAVEVVGHGLVAVEEVSTSTMSGLYNPQTVHGDIIVDGVRATTFTHAVKHATAHCMMMPVRAAFRFLGMRLTALEGGADMVADMLPSQA